MQGFASESNDGNKYYLFILVIKTCLKLLETQASVLCPEVREKLFQAIVMMRNKKILDPLVVIKLSFKLFSINDKALRLLVSDYIFNDIKAINQKKHNDKLNKAIQALLFQVVAEDNGVTARRTVALLSELYRRRIWVDARTVNGYLLCYHRYYHLSLFYYCNVSLLLHYNDHFILLL
jgi:hypothetical protein